MFDELMGQFSDQSANSSKYYVRRFRYSGLGLGFDPSDWRAIRYVEPSSVAAEHGGHVPLQKKWLPTTAAMLRCKWLPTTAAMLRSSLESAFFVLLTFFICLFAITSSAFLSLFCH